MQSFLGTSDTAHSCSSYAIFQRKWNWQYTLYGVWCKVRPFWPVCLFFIIHRWFVDKVLNFKISHKWQVWVATWIFNKIIRLRWNLPHIEQLTQKVGEGGRNKFTVYCYRLNGFSVNFSDTEHWLDHRRMNHGSHGSHDHLTSCWLKIQPDWVTKYASKGMLWLTYCSFYSQKNNKKNFACLTNSLVDVKIGMMNKM